MADFLSSEPQNVDCFVVEPDEGMETGAEYAGGTSERAESCLGFNVKRDEEELD